MSPSLEMILNHSQVFDAVGVLGLGLLALAAIKLARIHRSWAGKHARLRRSADCADPRLREEPGCGRPLASSLQREATRPKARKNLVQTHAVPPWPKSCQHRPNRRTRLIRWRPRRARVPRPRFCAPVAVALMIARLAQWQGRRSRRPAGNDRRASPARSPLSRPAPPCQALHRRTSARPPRVGREHAVGANRRVPIRS